MASVEVRPNLTIPEDESVLWNELTQTERVALDFARNAHRNHFRDDGVTPYLTHLIAVAWILKREMLQGEAVVIAGLLHDSVEDVGVTLEEIAEKFGEEVAWLVKAVTDLEEVGLSKQEKDLNSVKRVLSMAGQDERVLRIKLADRLHNIRTLRGKAAEKRAKKAKETLRVHVRTARELGQWSLANNMADIAFEYANPVEAASVKKLVDEDPRVANEFIGKWTHALVEYLATKGIAASVECAVSSYYQVYEKINQALNEGRRLGVGEISDLVSFRVIVEEESETAVFETVARLMGGFGDDIEHTKSKNRISAPAQNGYRAFHLVVRTEYENLNVEVAVATRKMEDFNRHGLREGATPPVMVLNEEGVVEVFGVGSTIVDYVYRVAVDPLMVEVAEVDGKRADWGDEIKSGTQIILKMRDVRRRLPEKSWMNFARPETLKLILAEESQYEHRKLIAEGTNLLEIEMAKFGLLRIEDLGEPLRFRILWMLDRADLAGVYHEIGVLGQSRAVEIAEVVATMLREYGVEDLMTITVDQIDDRPGILAVLNDALELAGVNILSQKAKSGVGEEPRIRVLVSADESMKDKLRSSLTKLSIGRMGIYGFAG